jgi:hypothetical protein
LHFDNVLLVFDSLVSGSETTREGIAAIVPSGICNSQDAGHQHIALFAIPETGNPALFQVFQ